VPLSPLSAHIVIRALVEIFSLGKVTLTLLE